MMNHFLHLLRQYTIQTILAVASLALAFSFGASTYQYVDFQTSFDRHHTAADSIYRVDLTTLRGAIGVKRYATVPGPVAVSIYRGYLSEGVVPGRLYQTFQQTPVISANGTTSYEERFFFSDPTIFRIFDFNVVQGDSEGLLTGPTDVVITERIAQKYFGDADPIGQTINFEGELPLTVTAVVESWPDNSHFQVDFLAGMNLRSRVFQITGTPEQWIGSWRWNPYHTFVRLPEGWTEERFESEVLAAIVEENRKPENTRMSLTPLTDLHLQTVQRSNVLQGQGNRAIIYAVTTGAGVLLLFSILQVATLLVTSRRDDIGFGATLGAASVLTVAGSGIGGGLYLAGVDWLHWVLAVPSQPSGGMAMATISAMAAAALVGAVLLSQVGRLAPRPFLQTASGVQVAMTILAVVLAAGTIRQMEYATSKPMGFAMEELSSIPIKNNQALRDSLASFRRALESTPAITSTALSSAVPGQGNHISSAFRTEGKYDLASAVIYFVDEKFSETIGARMIQTAEQEERADDLKGFVVNDSLASRLGWSPEEALGKRFISGDFGVVSGVQKSFHYVPLYEPVDPVVLRENPAETNFILLRASEGTDSQDVRAEVERVWKTYSPQRPLLMTSVESDMMVHYEDDQKLAGLSGLLAAMMSVLLLVAFAGRRFDRDRKLRKESAGLGVTFLLSTAVALPAGYVPLSRWLDRFAYHIDAPLWFFLGASVMCTALAVGVWVRSGTSGDKPETGVADEMEKHDSETGEAHSSDPTQPDDAAPQDGTAPQSTRQGDGSPPSADVTPDTDPSTSSKSSRLDSDV